MCASKEKLALSKKEKDGSILLTANRKKNAHILDLNQLNQENNICLASVTNEGWLWHRRLEHASMNPLFKLELGDLVKGLPKIEFVKDVVCEACQAGKKTKISFKAKSISGHPDHLSYYTSTCLDQFHCQVLEENLLFCDCG